MLLRTDLFIVGKSIFSPKNLFNSFSKLQEMIAKEINMDMGTYYHFAHNLHIYNDKLGL